LGQLSVEALIAAVEPVDLVDLRVAAGGKCGDDQRGAGAQVGRGYYGAA